VTCFKVPSRILQGTLKKTTKHFNDYNWPLDRETSSSVNNWTATFGL